MNYGNCCGCGKAVRYEKVNVCRECEDKYIEMVRVYARENGSKLSVDELHQGLGIPLKVLKLFEMNGFLQSIKNGEDIEIKNSQDEKSSKLALLKSLQQSFEEDNKNFESEKNGPRMHTNYRR